MHFILSLILKVVISLFPVNVFWAITDGNALNNSSLLCKTRESSPGVVANVLNCDIVDVHFQTNKYTREKYGSLYSKTMG